MRRSLVLFCWMLSACGSALGVDEADREALIFNGGDPLPVIDTGAENQGTSLHGNAGLAADAVTAVDYTHATLGDPLQNLQVTEGQLIASQSGHPLFGNQLVGTLLRGHTAGGTLVPLYIGKVSPAAPGDAEPGTTYAYWVVRQDPSTQHWSPLCQPDAKGRSDAFPVAAVWNTQNGNRVSSTAQFTFGCTKGVIAKCMIWGYRPWKISLDVNHPEQMIALHQTCTRAARADYCGNGDSNTVDGTTVDIYDSLPSKLRVEDPNVKIEDAVPKLPFEAGWDEFGAHCLTHWRWANFTESCIKLDGVHGPVDRLGAPRFCDAAEVAQSYPSVKLLFDSNEHYPAGLSSNPGLGLAPQP
jgi:hypothetical protein